MSINKNDLMASWLLVCVNLCSNKMIASWRHAWGAPNLPFVWVQLSAWTGNWGFDDLPCVEFYCPVITRIRLAQADVAGVSQSKSGS